MTDINKNIKKVCSFYASDWHLVTMLLPNIDKKINKGVKITTILENNLTEKMETLLEKLNLTNKQKVLSIKWNKTEINMENVINIIKNNDEIIINGTMEYIENIHKIIKQSIEENVTIQNKNITLIDCYDIEKYGNNIKEILDTHEKILNTAGEKNKEEYITSIQIAN